MTLHSSIYLVGVDLDQEHSKLLHSFDSFKPEDWTVFKHDSQSKWSFRGKTLAGGGLAESRRRLQLEGGVVIIINTYHE